MDADRFGMMRGSECHVAQRVLAALIRRHPGENVVISPHALAMALSSLGASVDDPALDPIAALLGQHDLEDTRGEIVAAERSMRDKNADNLPWVGWLPPVFHLTTAFSVWSADSRWFARLGDLGEPIRPSLYPVAAATSGAELRRLVDAWLRDRTAGAISSFGGHGRWGEGDSVVVASALDAQVEAAFAETTWAPGANHEQVPTEVVSCDVKSPTGSVARGFAAAPSFYFADSAGYRAVMMHAEPHAELHLLLPPEHAEPTLSCPPRYVRTRAGNRQDPALGARTPRVGICYPRWHAMTALDLRDFADDLGLTVLFDESVRPVALNDSTTQGLEARASIASLLFAARLDLGPRATINTGRFVRESGELDVLASRPTSCSIAVSFDRPFFALLTDELTGALLYAAYIQRW